MNFICSCGNFHRIDYECQCYYGGIITGHIFKEKYIGGKTVTTKNKKRTLIKYVDKERGIVYYYGTLKLWEDATRDDNHYRQMALADFAVDIKNNTVIKCRTSIEEILDCYVLNK